MRVPVPPNGWPVPPDAWLQKGCAAGQWRDGVMAAQSTNPALSYTYFGDEVAGLAPDGAGGLFVLTYCLSDGTNQGPYSLSHINSVGIRTASLYYGDPIAWNGLYNFFSAGAIVPSGQGHCIVVWANDQMHPGLSAQRYAANAAPLWGASPVMASSQTMNASGPACNLVAEPDGSDGVIAAWFGPQYANSPAPILCQRIDRHGNPLWGPDGVVLGQGFSGAAPHRTWLQLVPTGNGGAIVLWSRHRAPASTTYAAVTLDSTGTITQGPVTLARTRNDAWNGYDQVRRAVSDRAGGLFLAIPDDIGDLHCLRYSPASGIRWNRIFGHPINANCFSIREDGRGGCLLGFVAAAPLARLELKRLDGAGNVTWDIAAAGGPAIPVRLPSTMSISFPYPEIWARMAQAVPDGAGGAIALYQDAHQDEFRIFTTCFDSHGARRSPVQAMSARTGWQQLPALAPGATGQAFVAWDDQEDIIYGGDVWAQRLGCCPLTQLLAPFQAQYRCLIDTAGSPRGQFSVDFPCGDRSRQVGVLPLSYLSARGLDCPGCITNRAASAPDWMRIRLAGLSSDVGAELQRADGKTVARSSDIKAAGAAASLRVLTFAPSVEEDYLLVFTHRGPLEPDRHDQVQIRMAWGNGSPPPLPAAKAGDGNRPAQRKARAKAKTKRERAR